MRHSLFRVNLAFLCGLSLAGLPLQADEIYDHSGYWPIRVQAKGPIGDTVKDGMAGILIRVNPDQTHVVDFGRRGLLTLPYKATTLEESFAQNRFQCEEQANCREEGLMSNFLVNKLVGDIELNLYPHERLKDKEYFVLLYGEVKDDEFTKVSTDLRGTYKDMSDEARRKIEVVFIPLQANKEENNEYYQAEDLPWPMMIHYFAPGYIKTFAHYPGEGPVLVTVDKNGKVLARYDANDEVSDASKAPLTTGRYSEWEQSLQRLLQE